VNRLISTTATRSSTLCLCFDHCFSLFLALKNEKEQKKKKGVVIMDISNLYHHLSKIQAEASEDENRLSALRVEKSKLEDTLTKHRATNQGLLRDLTASTRQVHHVQQQVAALEDEIQLLRNVQRRDQSSQLEWTREQEAACYNLVQRRLADLQSRWNAAILRRQTPPPIARGDLFPPAATSLGEVRQEYEEEVERTTRQSGNGHEVPPIRAAGFVTPDSTAATPESSSSLSASAVGGGGELYGRGAPPRKTLFRGSLGNQVKARQRATVSLHIIFSPFNLCYFPSYEDLPFFFYICCFFFSHKQLD
jgi:hypothetical protein